MRTIINLSSRRAAAVELGLIAFLLCAALATMPAIDRYASRHVAAFITNLNPV
jgi:hypothetical protein